ncbi:MAG: pilus assembly protein PilM, partial [Candidatus Omnitrophica bacterium]|nr:pilus assembly protein PilM [Candidatus Omnitrophota bacterium]
MNNPDKSENKDSPRPKKAASRFSPQEFLSLLKGFVAPSRNVIGIDIGSSYIKILQLARARKGYVISSCATRAIPANLKEDHTEKKRFIQTVIKEFIQDTRKKNNLGRLSVSGKGIFVFSLAVPAISRKDLKGLVSIELKKRLPFQMDINNMVFDFFITGQVADDKGQPNLQVTCIAADKVSIDEQIGFLKEMDIKPVAINVSSDALGNVLPYCIEKASEKTTVLLDMGANVSLLNFYKGKNLVFFREIPVGGEHLTRAMAKTITAASGTLDLSFEDAEKIKRNCGIPLEDEARVEFLTDFGVLLGEQISGLLRPVLERLILEINRTVSYYTKTFKADFVEELYITGGTSRLKNIDKFLLYNLERLKKVERLDILKSVKGWSETGGFRQELVVEQAAPHLAVAFGLCFG